MKKIYLAMPYSHPSPKIREASYLIANWATCVLIEKHGFNPYSPISHNHPLARDHGLSGDWQYWQEIDRSMIDWADEVYVLCEPGWRLSTGVQAEIRYAEKIGKPIKYISRDEMKSDGMFQICYIGLDGMLEPWVTE